LVLIGGLLAAGGTFWAAILQLQSSREMRDLALANADLSNRIAQKSEEISRLSTHIVGAVTGGGSFVYLEPLRRSVGVRYFLRQKGEYPTYDVVVRIQRVENGQRRLLFGPVGVGTLRRGSGFDWTIPSASEAWPLSFAEPPDPNSKAQEFRVEIAARNGVFVQRLRVQPVAGRWKTDSRQGDDAPLILPDDFKEAQEQQ
jgi:hypothetical protein